MTRFAAREILEDVIWLIGDVALITHHIEMDSISIACERVALREVGMGNQSSFDACRSMVEDGGAGSGKEGKDMKSMRHKLVLIKNLDRNREELVKLR